MKKALAIVSVCAAAVSFAAGAVLLVLCSGDMISRIAAAKECAAGRIAAALETVSRHIPRRKAAD